MINAARSVSLFVSTSDFHLPGQLHRFLGGRSTPTITGGVTAMRDVKEADGAKVGHQVSASNASRTHHAFGSA